MTESLAASAVAPSEAINMAQVAGIELPTEFAEGVAERLSQARHMAKVLRAEGIGDVPAFQAFDLRPAQPQAGDGAAVLANSMTQPRSGSDPELPAVSTTTAEPTGMDLSTLARALERRAVSPVEVATAYLERIESLNPRLRAYITVTAERALDDAHQAEAEIAAGSYRGAMHGIPIAHKDLLETAGIRTTYHTHHYRDHVPDRDAPVAASLRQAGSVLLGKANTLELGAGDGDVFGMALNPWDEARQTGGSSSGSATALAARMTCAATGTDAGGSIRVPASFCGVFGLKPTVGVVASEPDSNGISVAGPMTRSALDAAIMLEAMLHQDLQAGLRATYEGMARRVSGDVRGWRVGVPVDWLDTHLEDSVRLALEHAQRSLVSGGAEVREISLPHAALSEVAGAVITHVECFGRYRQLLDAGAQMGKFIRELLTASQLYSAADYLMAQRARTLMIRELSSAFDLVDIILLPVTPYGPARLDQQHEGIPGTGATPRTGMGRFTRLSNLTGLPSASVPVGFDVFGMPTAVQLIGRPFGEEAIIQVAHRLELDKGDRGRLPNGI